MKIQIIFFLILKYLKKVTKVRMNPIQKKTRAKLFKNLILNGVKKMITEIKKKNVLNLPN